MKSEYVVTGMTCGHCVAHVQEEVCEISGVSDVQVELASGKMTITSEAPIEFSAVAEAVAEAGDYQVSLA